MVNPGLVQLAKIPAWAPCLLGQDQGPGGGSGGCWGGTFLLHVSTSPTPCASTAVCACVCDCPVWAFGVDAHRWAWLPVLPSGRSASVHGRVGPVSTHTCSQGTPAAVCTRGGWVLSCAELLPSIALSLSNKSATFLQLQGEPTSQPSESWPETRWPFQQRRGFRLACFCQPRPPPGRLA